MDRLEQFGECGLLTLASLVQDDVIKLSDNTLVVDNRFPPSWCYVSLSHEVLRCFSEHLNALLFFRGVTSSLSP
jgi:hypothetical protein